MDRQKAQTLVDEINAAAKAIAAAHGMTWAPARCTFDTAALTVKLQLVEAREDGVALTREAQDFIALAFTYGIAADALGKPITSGGRSFRIVGLKSRSRNPILADDASTGRRFKLPAEHVARVYPHRNDRNGTEG